MRTDVPLSDYTTIGLGGLTTHFAACENLEQVSESLTFARDNHLRAHILGGGSNLIFADEGFKGLVIQVALRGVIYHESGESVEVIVSAGEPWDQLVRCCIDRHLAGVECLSGIPGFAGATPIQNVGAYGQEVRETIVSLKALHRETLKLVEFSGAECRFAYRQSRFKSEDAEKYVITEVTYSLRKNGRPEIRYPELAAYLESHTSLSTLESGRPVLRAVREAVLALRQSKSMVVDPADPDSRSVGSFFMNPVLAQDEFQRLEERWKQSGMTNPIPSFPAGTGIKVPAAWLVEQSGFRKGFRRGGVGISPHHALALVNYGGSTHEILDLAVEIQGGVLDKFGIRLEREPVVVTS